MLRSRGGVEPKSLYIKFDFMEKYYRGGFLFFPCLLFCFCLFFSCSGKWDSGSSSGIIENPGLFISDSLTPFEDIRWIHAERMASFMTNRQRANQVLMTGIDGNKSFASYLYAHFEGTVPGAILLFGYNIGGTGAQVKSFLSGCSSAFQKIGTPVPVIFAIDHEGGDVFRTKGVTSFLPSAEKVASTLDIDVAEALYASAGRELAALGIKLNLAPVFESYPENSSFMGSRIFSPDPAVSSAYAAAAVRGFQSSGVLCAVKHFPGNGGGDPHSFLPVVNASLDECEDRYFAPFRDVLKENPAAVLVSHVVFSAVDNVPFCLSKKGVTGILRSSLGFKGLVLTDDISMGALSQAGWPEDKAAVSALAAGCDLVMTSSTGIKKIAGAIVSEAERNDEFAARLEQAAAKVVFLKMTAGIMDYPGIYEKK